MRFILEKWNGKVYGITKNNLSNKKLEFKMKINEREIIEPISEITEV